MQQAAGVFEPDASIGLEEAHSQLGLEKAIEMPRRDARQIRHDIPAQRSFDARSPSSEVPSTVPG